MRRTASRLLLRLVKTLRNRLHPFIHLIIEVRRDTLPSDFFFYYYSSHLPQSLRTELQMSQPLLVKEALEEQLGLVEAVGSLVGSVPPTAQADASTGVAAHISAFLVPYGTTVRLHSRKIYFYIYFVTDVYVCLSLVLRLFQIVEYARTGRCVADADVVVLGQQVQCLIAFSKGFSSLASPDARALWKQVRPHCVTHSALFR